MTPDRLTSVRSGSRGGWVQSLIALADGPAVGELRANLGQPARSRQGSGADVVEPGHMGVGGHGTLAIEIATMAFPAQAFTQLSDYNAYAAYVHMMVTNE